MAKAKTTARAKAKPKAKPKPKAKAATKPSAKPRAKSTAKAVAKPKKAITTKKTAAKQDKEVTVDRRAVDGRRSVEDRRKKNVPIAVERRGNLRRKVTRRRQIDPTTCERDYTTEEIEFMQALDEYKRTSGRMFPTCSEILEVVRGLGYYKGAKPEPTPDVPEVEQIPTADVPESTTVCA